MPPSEQKLWTVQIQGGKPFEAHLKGNPPLEHQGRNTVAHLVLTAEEATALRGLAVLQGCRVEIFLPEGQTLEQAEERTTLLNQQDRVWPCAVCPSCAWLDPLLQPSPCGLEGLPPESVATLRATSQAHRKGEADCPLRGR